MRRSALPLLLVLSLLAAACSSSVEALLGSNPTEPTTEDSATTVPASTSTTAPSTTVTTVVSTTTSIEWLPSGEKFGLAVALPFFIGVFGLEPTDAQVECMLSLDELTIEVEPYDSVHLPVVMMQMCMGDELADSMLARLEANPDITPRIVEGFACSLELGRQRVEGMSLNERLIDARTDATQAEQDAILEQCQLTLEDIEEALDAALG